MSKVQPNHKRRIMQTGLGQPPQITLCSKHKTKLWKLKGELERVGWREKRCKKLAIL